MSTVVPITANPRFRPAPSEVTRRQLQRIIGYGKSKIFEFQAAGMPYRTCPRRRINLYDPHACSAWLNYHTAANVDPGHNNPQPGGNTHA